MSEDDKVLSHRSIDLFILPTGLESGWIVIASKLSLAGPLLYLLLGGRIFFIQQRQANRAGAFFDALEEKYAPKGKGKGKKRPAVAEPPEEAFAATAARKTSGQKKTRKTKA